jgi:sterol desaturase/sphingolipid hydroxylase (fatty acid hydroxylase superfamily)
MLGIPLGILYSNAGEWFIHKHVLHGLGRNKSSFWAFHFHEHHKAVRRLDGYDPDYERSPFRWNAQGKEVAALAAGALAHAPLFPVAPLFVTTVWAHMVLYWYVHRRSHLDPQWGKERLRWHYDHHMGPDQDQNWCVTWPLFDYVMGTRVPYVGTERHKRDAARRAERAPAPA